MLNKFEIRVRKAVEARLLKYKTSLGRAMPTHVVNVLFTRSIDKAVAENGLSFPRIISKVRASDDSQQVHDTPCFGGQAWLLALELTASSGLCPTQRLIGSSPNTNPCRGMGRQVLQFTTVLLSIYAFLFIGFAAFTQKTDRIAGAVNSAICFTVAAVAWNWARGTTQESVVRDEVSVVEKRIMTSMRKMFDVVSEQVGDASRLQTCIHATCLYFSCMYV